MTSRTTSRYSSSPTVSQLPSTRPPVGDSAATATPLSPKNCFTTGHAVAGGSATTSQLRPARRWIFTASSLVSANIASGRGARLGKWRARGFGAMRGMS